MMRDSLVRHILCFDSTVTFRDSAPAYFVEFTVTVGRLEPKYLRRR